MPAAAMQLLALPDELLVEVLSWLRMQERWAARLACGPWAPPAAVALPNAADTGGCLRPMCCHGPPPASSACS